MANKYYIQTTVKNDYLGKSSLLKAATQHELDIKVQNLKTTWDKQEATQREKDKITDLKQLADDRTADAEKLINDYKNILKKGIKKPRVFKWEKLYKNAQEEPFVYRNPPTLEEFQTKLNVPKKSFAEYLVRSKLNKRLELEQRALEEYTAGAEFFHKEKELSYNEWKEGMDSYNGHIGLMKSEYEDGGKEGIEYLVMRASTRQSYPDNCISNFEFEFDKNSKTIVISVQLPNTDEIPKVCAYKYEASSKKVKPVEIKPKEFNQFYDQAIKQMVLTVIHTALVYDYKRHIQAVVLNGWINSISKATGKEFSACIISVRAERKSFEEINLGLVDANECIRGLKALYAGNLTNLAPVKPIMELNRQDSRFIASKDILQDLKEGDNLATMDWEDFEHLVRELFAKYFSADGAEVKVTQSSRDKGVDAIAFDSDPIKGGKYVIQAKRYNNVVPVSAVRDLYGTMMNEGAVKGILVTTSYYGNDSREFAKNKPISLIDGQNLIHMFSEFGYEVHIELQKN